MTVEFWKLTDIFYDCGIDTKFAESFVTWADWEFTEGEHVLVYARKVIPQLISYVVYNFTVIADTNGEQIDDTVVRKEIENYFVQHLYEGSLIDIAN
jgi:hypothetical protein